MLASYDNSACMVNGYAGVRNRYHPYLKDSVKMHPREPVRGTLQRDSG
jgi:hypothetical protein